MMSLDVYIKKSMSLCVICLLVTQLSGCAEYFEPSKQPDVKPTYPADIPPPPKRDGGIYQSGYEISLYQDRIAHHVGDVLTIKLEESTNGAKKSKTKTNKKATNQFAVNEAFGANLTNGLGLDTATDQQFDGNGESNQENNLTGTISVTVTKVLSNNSMIVDGESWVTINFGKEYVQLSGIVREEDIEPDNTVSSQRVAHARITYSGNGQVANSSRGGAITQLFFKMFPF